LSKGQLKALEDGYKVVLMSELLRRNSQVKKKIAGNNENGQNSNDFRNSGSCFVWNACDRRKLTGWFGCNKILAKKVKTQ